MQQDTQIIQEFHELAARYCLIIENVDGYDLLEFLTQVREILPRIYSLALKLPETELNDGEYDHTIEHEEWSVLFMKLQKKLGKYDLFWNANESTEDGDIEALAGCLSDDLADIWLDLKGGAIDFADADVQIVGEIVWDWKFSFHSHWSTHLCGALARVNCLFELRRIF